MLRNPITILITAGVLIAIAVALQFLNTQEKNVSEAVVAVPEDAAMVLETNQIYNLIRNFNTNNQFRKEFRNTEEFSGFFEQSAFIDSLLSANSELKKMLEGKKIMISGHVSANNQMEFLWVLPVIEKSSFEFINKTIADIISNDATIRQRQYEGNTIYDVVFFREESKLAGFSYTFAKGLFIFSLSKIQIEASLRRISKNYSLEQDKAFRKLMESAGKNVDANLYLNYKYLPNLFKNILKTGNGDFYDFISGFASWSELDILMKNDALLMSGFTFSDDSLSQYLNAYKGQSNINNEFLEVLPGNTSAFIAFNLSDAVKWKDAYFKILQKSGEYPRIESKMEELESTYGKGNSMLFYKNVEGCVASVWLPSVESENGYDHLGVIQFRDVDAVLAEIEKMRQKDSLSRSPVKVDQNSSVIAYPFPESNLLSVLFGKAFSNVDASWFANFNGYFIFGKSVAVIQNYIYQIKNGKKLKDDKNFELFSKSISSESNLFLYSDISSSKNIFSDELNSKYLAFYNKNLEKINKIRAVSIQFGASGKLLSTNVYLSMSPGMNKNSKNSWETALDASFDMKPQIVKSHLTGNNEIILQDESFNLILVNENGKVQWKKKLSGKILGEIHQVDLFKNNKFQFIFNTRDYLYLVDRNGKDVEDYPIKLKSPATCGMAVFDYDRDRTYRILIACANKSVYLLNTNGIKVDGWEFGQTESEVTLPAQHFVSGSKDYIVFGDKTNTYIVNRRGETRIQVKSKFERNPNSQYYFEKGESESDSRFVTTGSNGDIYFIFLDGQVKKMTIDDFSPGHLFMYADIEGDGKNQFIFADENKLYVYNRDKSVKFEEKFDGPVNKSMNLYKLTKNARYIGVAPEGTGKIYLINTKGETVKGFPLRGKGSFSITKLLNSEKNNDLNLIVGNEENFLLNYRLGTGENETKQE